MTVSACSGAVRPVVYGGNGQGYGTYYGRDSYGHEYFVRVPPRKYRKKKHNGGGGYSSNPNYPPFMAPHAEGHQEGEMHRYIPENPHSGYVPSEGFSR